MFYDKVIPAHFRKLEYWLINRFRKNDLICDLLTLKNNKDVKIYGVGVWLRNGENALAVMPNSTESPIIFGIVPAEDETIVFVECQPRFEVHLAKLWGEMLAEFSDVPKLTKGNNPLARPEAPPNDASLDKHFEWYHQCRKTGFRVTLGAIAKNTGYSESHVKRSHSEWKAEHE